MTRAPRAAEDTDWQKLWLTTQCRTWASLAVVPAGPGASSSVPLEVAVNLAHVGPVHPGAPVQVADATELPLDHLVGFTEELARLKVAGERAIIAVPPLSESPVALALVQATEAALLCVVAEQMHTRDARETVARVGAGRFLGSELLQPPGKGTR
ncbi:MAG: hypothetical protein FJ104_12135 [Deltaproteobacteria bacterium]|nr:hypothetical protein [Deltaproteobacteria bacterium]